MHMHYTEECIILFREISKLVIQLQQRDQNQSQIIEELRNEVQKLKEVFNIFLIHRLISEYPISSQIAWDFDLTNSVILLFS